MPASPGLTTSGWTMSSNAAMTTSPFDRSQQVQEWPGEMWQIKCSLPPMTRAEASAWLSFFASLHGPVGTFMLGPYPLRLPLGPATGAVANSLHQVGLQGPFVYGDTNGKGQFSIATGGWQPNTPSIMEAGDFFQIGNHLHMMVSTEDADANGRAAFDIWPSLRETPQDGDPIIVTSPQCMFRLASNDFEFDIDSAAIFTFSFNAIEVL